MHWTVAVALGVIGAGLGIAGASTSESRPPESRPPESRSPESRSPSESPSSAEQEPVSQVPLRIVLANKFTPPDPHYRTWQMVDSLYSGIYDALLAIDADGGLVPALAESWTLQDERTYRFKLRAGVLFHHGRPFDSKDVVFALERARNFPAGEYRGKLAAVESIRALDELTVEIVTHRVDPLLLRQLAGLAIVPTGSPDQITQPIGTGPYRWVGRVAEGRIRLEAYKEYWAAPANEPVVEVIMEPDGTKRVQLLKQREADLIVLGHDHLQAVETDDELWVFSRVTSGVIFMGLQVHHPPLDDRRVRRAIHLAFDRAAMVENVFDGYARAAAQLASPGTFGYEPQRKPQSQDLATARSLLKDAGHEGLKLVIHCPRSRIKLATQMVENLAEAGFDATMKPQGWDDLIRDMESGKAPAYLIGWSNTVQDLGDVFDHLLHSKDPKAQHGLNNETRFSDPEIDRWIRDAGSTLDSDARLPLLSRISDAADRESVVIPLIWEMKLWAGSKGLQWAPRSDGILDPYEMRRTDP